MLMLMLLLLQALFEAGRASVKTHKEHLLQISDSAEPGGADEAAAEQQPAPAAGPSNAAGASVHHVQSPAVASACVVEAMLHGLMTPLQRQVRRATASAWLLQVKRCVYVQALATTCSLDAATNVQRSDQH
jgi:hypothetical protein